MTDEQAPSASRPVHDHEVHWDVRVPVRDGLELSANIWRPRPRDAARERFLVILEMIPYGKDNWRRNWDTAFGERLAARGFALCRLDVRGTSSSPGIAMLVRFFDRYLNDVGNGWEHESAVTWLERAWRERIARRLL